MGSQTLEILRQGVWASVTGGWFYDPYQGVFCNVVHLYLWLFLVCSPFVAYLYFPRTWLTWCIYCVLTSLTILLVKLANMALHRLYDRAQTMSEANLKDPFIKVTKETEKREYEPSGIEMKVLHGDVGGNSVEQAINEASEENSMMSMENVNSVMDLKVDVHRKNSSESLDMLFYAPLMAGGSAAASQHDQHSTNSATASVSKSIRSASTNPNAKDAAQTNPADIITKYLSVYPEHDGDDDDDLSTQTSTISGPCPLHPHLWRKSSEVFKRRHHRRRLERQSSLDAGGTSSASALASHKPKLLRNQSDTIAPSSSASAGGSGISQARKDTFLHSHALPHASGVSKSASVAVVNASATSTTTTAGQQQQQMRLNANATGTPRTEVANSTGAIAKSTRLQRHRSSETHDERLKQQQRGLFMPIHHEQQHSHLLQPRHQRHHSHNNPSSAGSSSSAIADGILDAEIMEMGGSAEQQQLPAWILGSSSDVYIDDDNFTKSDFGIEQLDSRTPANAKARATFLLQQQQHLNAHYQHQQRYNNNNDDGFFPPTQQMHQALSHPLQQLQPVKAAASMLRKDSNSTKSALQLPVGGGALSSTGHNIKSSGGIKRRRHSNAAGLSRGLSSASATARALAALQPTTRPTVRRIKSAALEISCPRPSVSNLSPHPNSLEAISGQQQIKNPPSALLPPPSKCMVRNPHYNLCPKFGGSGESMGAASSGSSLNYGGTVDPIVEQLDEKSSLDRADVVCDGDCQKRLASCGEQQQTGEDMRGAIGPEQSSVRVPAVDGDGDGDNNDDDDHDLTDEFKYFDDNWENILTNMEHNCNELDNLQVVDEPATQKQQSEPSNKAVAAGVDYDEEELPDSSTPHRQRLHSTDSETETNNAGSRSPLLSKKKKACWAEVSPAEAAKTSAADAAMRSEIAAVQRQKPSGVAGAGVSGLRAVHAGLKGEADSGCPSSDCEQISSSSKDMLLSGLEADEAARTAMHATDVESGGAVETLDSTPHVLSTKGKSQGAIPKDVKYREVDETRAQRSAALANAAGSSTSTPATMQVHKRRSGKNSQAMATGAQSHSSTSSSSASSRSLSVDSLTADIHKMLWIMHGGALDDKGRPVYGFTPDGQPISMNPNVIPPNLSSAHFEFYQDALQTLHPKANLYFREHYGKRQRAKQSGNELSTECENANQTCPLHDSDSGGAATRGAALAAAATPASMLNATNSTTSKTSLIPARPAHSTPNSGLMLGGVIGRSTNVNNSTALSIQGLINVINDERGGMVVGSGSSSAGGSGGPPCTRSGSLNPQSRGSGAGSLHPNNNTAATITNAAAAAALLNSEVHHQVDSYYEYLRPSCILTLENPVQPKSFYKYHFKCFGYERDFKISMDRLELLSLFDRDLHWLHVLFAVVLCFLVAYLGATILQLGFYQDLTAFIFCVVIAGAQYSLVKSVQPDAASPIHGFNKTVAYSRAIYFTVCGFILLLFVDKAREYKRLPTPPNDFCFFGVHYSPATVVHHLTHCMFSVLLLFPMIFSLGLFPQVNTFLMYLMEQIDMHVFGGNAAGSLVGSILCVVRSVLGVMLLYGPLYAALSEGKGTQFVLFSFFCAMLIPLGYHLSRSASDFSHIWALLKNCIVSTYHDNDDEVSAAIVAKEVTQKNANCNHKRSSNSIKRKQSVKRQDTDKSLGGLATPSAENIEMSSLGVAKYDGDLTGDLKKVNEAEEHDDGATPAATAGDDDGDDDDDEAEEDETNFDRKSSKSKGSSLASSSQTLAKTLSSSRKAITGSNSLASVADHVEEDEDDDGEEEAAAPVSETQRVECEDPASEKPLTESSRDASLPYTVKDIDEVFELVTEEISELPVTQPDDRQVKTAPEPLQTTGDDLLDKESTSSTTHPCDISTLTAGGVDGAPAATTDGAPLPHAGGVAEADNDTSDNAPDPLPKKLHNTVHTRLKNDLVVTAFLGLVVFSLHCSTVFTVLQPDLNVVLYAFTGALGLLLHYIIPQMRKHMPWLCFSRPILRQKEYGLFEVSNAAKVMWFEKVYIYLCMLERNVLFPLLAISALTADTQTIVNKYGIAWGTFIVAVCAMKFVRNSYSDPTNQYLIILFTVLFFRVDFAMASETFLIDYFFVSLAYRKCCDFLLKLQFIVTYIAPWQITWGSAFHAFAQPFSVPHSAMLFLQAGISAILSTPLNPFLGSAIFMTSYVRPIKFWERDYNTRRIDHSNTRLSSQLERDLGADDNNLNSIFYEHLTRSLQHSLCGDLIMGRWGNVNQGDCFVLASDYLNCLVHIIELGNGLCTFQMRGLEFRGTYCQQREVEAITEDVEDNDGCCCCDPGHLPRMLSVNAMFSTRWLAWQVVAAKYVLEGYSISDNLASATLQVFEYRKVLITYYIKSIIYYVIKSSKLEEWLESAPIQEALQHTLNRQFADLDPIFNFNLDEDFDFRAMGITRSSFCFIYLNWINFCYDKRMQSQLINAGFPNPVNMAHTNTPNAANDSKSTPNLSVTTTPAATGAGGTPTTTAAQSTATTAVSQAATAAPQVKSQSQQQLRMRTHKSTTMSDSGTSVLNNHSNEHMATSQSFANISRQTSESAPGLSAFSFTTHPSGASATVNTTSSPITQAGTSNASTGGGGAAFFDNAGGGGGGGSGAIRLTKSSARFMRNPDSAANHTPSGVGRSASVEENGGRTDDKFIKLNVPSVAKDSPIVSLCLALSLLARRSLATASHSSLTGVEFFLHGLHALFKGDFRITSPRDEWVFADMDLLHSVVAPAVKMALKLQQDHISNPDEFLDPNELYDAIDNCSRDLVISHEADPVWRSAVLRGAPNLLALRHVMEDGSDEYRIIRLTKRFLSFRVIKLNRECVRGLWAGQQQELIYLRNRNPERGSIQNAKQALRNIINSSCDQPIGYPIYVSPLTTSYADTNEQLKQVIGGPITPESIKTNVLDWWHRFRERCRQGCSSGSGMESSNVGVVALAPGSASGGGIGGGPVYISAPLYNTLRVGNLFDLRPSNVASIASNFGSQFRSDANGLGQMRSGEVGVVPLKPISTTLLAELLQKRGDHESNAAGDRKSQRGDHELGEATGSSGLRKSQTHTQAGSSLSAAERERRATLPITVMNYGAFGRGEKEAAGQLLEKEVACPLHGCPASSSPRYTKISSSSGNLGIGNIITTPGDYPRKSKGPICLTAAAAANAKEFHLPSLTTPRKPNIDLFKRVMIVNESEIYECMDSGNRIDVVWPNEEIRTHADESAWLDWEPHAGMVGRVVHYWIPYHSDERFRSHINDIVYLLEIGEHYVPVGEYGLQEYIDTPPPPECDTPLPAEYKRRHYERQDCEHRRPTTTQPERGLTPILGSSVESPTSSHLAASCSRATGATPKIKAVSSSSSEDELGLQTLEMQRREMLLNMWKMIAEQTTNSATTSQSQEQTPRAEQPKESLDDGGGGVVAAARKASSEESLLTERKEQQIFEDLRQYLQEMRVANKALRRKAQQQPSLVEAVAKPEQELKERVEECSEFSETMPPAPPPSSTRNTPEETSSSGGSEEVPLEVAEIEEAAEIVKEEEGEEEEEAAQKAPVENATNANGATDLSNV